MFLLSHSLTVSSPVEGVSLLEVNPCLQGFISTVVSSRAAESSIISFALKLTGLVAAAEDGFRALQVGLISPAFHQHHTAIHNTDYDDDDDDALAPTGELCPGPRL